MENFTWLLSRSGVMYWRYGAEWHHHLTVIRNRISIEGISGQGAVLGISVNGENIPSHTSAYHVFG